MSKWDRCCTVFMGVWLWATWSYWFPGEKNVVTAAPQVFINNDERRRIEQEWQSLPVSVNVCRLVLRHHRYRLTAERPEDLSQWQEKHPLWEVGACDVCGLVLIVYSLHF